MVMEPVHFCVEPHLKAYVTYICYQLKDWIFEMLATSENFAFTTCWLELQLWNHSTKKEKASTRFFKNVLQPHFIH